LVGCGSHTPAQPDAASDPPGRLELVGHDPLLSRGMNAALAVAGDTVYVGSRTDGLAPKNQGVLIVSVADPTQPTVVGEIGPPDEGLLGMTSRELRAVPDLNLLIVMNIECAPDLHACHRDPALVATGGAAETDNFRFYDITDRHHPHLVGRYDFGTSAGSLPFAPRPHEFFLWRDPAHPARILLYVTTPLGPPSMVVLDASDPTHVTQIATWDSWADGGLTDETLNGPTLLHSLSVSPDGTRGFVAHEGVGFFMVDTSDLAMDLPSPRIRLLTPIAQRLDYSPPSPPGTHSAVQAPGRDVVVLTDEIYAEPWSSGCPWGWMRTVDISDPTHPTIAGEYKLPENDASQCAADHGPMNVTFTAHNPTLTPSLAFVSWHAGGLQVVDITDPTAPTQVTSFSPSAPLTAVITEDPSFGGNPVTMWSYPIIQDGLIYVVDVRNGLYILRYHGVHEDEVTAAGFAEGNSSL
jgi:hypothetical protein